MLLADALFPKAPAIPRGGVYRIMNVTRDLDFRCRIVRSLDDTTLLQEIASGARRTYPVHRQTVADGFARLS